MRWPYSPRPRFERLAERYRGHRSVRCYHTSSVPLERFPTRADVEGFYRGVRSRLHVPWEEWLAIALVATACGFGAAALRRR